MALLMSALSPGSSVHIGLRLLYPLLPEGGAGGDNQLPSTNMGTQSLRATSPDIMVAFLLRAYGLLDDKGIRLCNIAPSLQRTCTIERSNTPFSGNPKGLINLFETVLFTHQPIWYAIQQLMRVLSIYDRGVRGNNAGSLKECPLRHWGIIN